MLEKYVMLKFGGVMADNNYNNLISKKRKSESFSFLSSLKYIVCLGTIFYLFSSSNDLKTKKDCIPYDNTKLILESSDVDDIVLNLEREFGVEIDDQNIDSLVLLNSILENENINNDDKKIFYGFYSIVEDCKYLDKENAYKKISQVFKNLNYYSTKVIRDESSVEYTSTIQYDKVDMEKLKALENSEDSIIKDGKIKVKDWLEFAEQFGTKCEEK